MEGKVIQMPRPEGESEGARMVREWLNEAHAQAAQTEDEE